MLFFRGLFQIYVKQKFFLILVNDHFITLFLQYPFVKSSTFFDYLPALKIPKRRVNISRKQ